MKRYVFDIEGDGFLDKLTTIHSLVLKDVDTGEMFSFHYEKTGDHNIHRGLWLLGHADEIIGHNIIGYDLPALRKVAGFVPSRKTKLIDTLVLSRLLFSFLDDIDGKLVKAGKLPPKLFGKHKLEAWGHRLGNYKGAFDGPWDRWSPEMQTYCEQDVEVTYTLWQKLQKPYSERAIDLEHGVAKLCTKIEENGFCFDKDAAIVLYEKLAKRRLEVLTELQLVFPPIIHERYSEKTGKRLKDREEVFNPDSRQQIARRLTERHGWTPTLFTSSGQAQIDETVLSRLEYPEAKLLEEHLLLSKRIGQVAEGDQAWLRLERDGRIHGSINPNGAVTGRATHSRPNISQVPSANLKKDGTPVAPYGPDCRRLFVAPPGFVLVGADTSGLELRCLAHFMAKHDGGQYVKVVTEGDVHSVNQEAASLPTRDNAKTFIYAFLYGAGDGKIGSIVVPTASEKIQRTRGKNLRAQFLSKLPALNALINEVKGAAEARGYLKGLDGRHLHVRSDHAALNTLLQSAGALVCKQWLLLIESKLLALGLKHGWDGDFAFNAWSHDEVQISVRKGLEQTVGKICVEAAREAGEAFNFRCPLTGEYKVGRTWAETH